MFDEEIRELVVNDLDGGTIVEFAETQPIFALVEAGFPLGLNRIAWEKVGRKEYAEIFPVATGCKKTEEIEARLASRRDQVREWLEAAGVGPNAEVSWVGDSTDIGLTMKMEILLENFPKLFSLPQHSYVLPKDGTWCLNYVMEGELFFARAGKNDGALPHLR